MFNQVPHLMRLSADSQLAEFVLDIDYLVCSQDTLTKSSRLGVVTLFEKFNS